METKDIEQYVGKNVRYAIIKPYTDKIIVFKGFFSRILEPNAFFEDKNGYLWRVSLDSLQFIDNLEA